MSSWWLGSTAEQQQLHTQQAVLQLLSAASLPPACSCWQFSVQLWLFWQEEGTLEGYFLSESSLIEPVG
jgi:hypothetical protein